MHRAHPAIVTRSGVNLTQFASFAESMGGACGGGVTYSLAIAPNANVSDASAKWYWWDAAALGGAGMWAVSDGTSAQSSTAASIGAHVADFPIPTPAQQIFTKAFLHSNGFTGCELDALTLTGIW